MVIGGGALPAFDQVVGHMFDDANGNGVWDVGEVGLAGRQLHVFDTATGGSVGAPAYGHR